MVAARERAGFEAELAEINRRIDDLSHVRSADPKGKLLAKLFGLVGAEHVDLVTSLILVCIVCFVQLGQIYIGSIVFPGREPDPPNRPPKQSLNR